MWNRRNYKPGLIALGVIGVIAISDAHAPALLGCSIKGNISYNSGEKIYHVVGQTFYDDTIISPDKGERWFCSEEEAVAAGWRKSRR
jgi:hypothetical protein